MFPVKRLLREALSPRRVALIALGMAITTFGLFNIHRRVDVTEGGVLGMVLAARPSLRHSAVAFDRRARRGLLFPRLARAGYEIPHPLRRGHAVWFGLFPPLGVHRPDSAQFKRSAAFGGASGRVLCGRGRGLVVRQGGSSGGDDALALVIAKKTKWRLSRAYLFTDLTVLALSLTYIAPMRIIWSLITVTTSSLLIDFVKSAGRSEKRQNA